jgi:hypothetical protein
MKRWLTGASLLVASGWVAACPLCGDWQGSMPLGSAYRQRVASAPPATGAIQGESPAVGSSDIAVVYRLDRDMAANAVLALSAEGGARLKVIDVIQGDFPIGSTIDSAWVDRLDRSAAASTKPLLLIRARKWQAWDNLGPVGAEHAGWLRQLTASKPTANMTDTEWQARAALVLPYLENPEPLVAEIAYGELARAPYSAMRPLKSHLDAAALRQWTADPRLAKRQSLYTLLLGIAGDATDTARIEQRLDAAWKAKDATNLGPMLAADLELRGPSRMAWIDTRYMGDSDRSTQELQAALLALSVQGSANDTIPRKRVIDSYRMFIEVHKPIAGFVAQDLATWNYWDAGPEYVALLHSDVAQHPASRYAMLNYLKQSPQADAKAALNAWAIAK